MEQRTRFLRALATCACLVLIAPVARANEDANPFRVGLPPQPFYAADQRILISDPEDGSVLPRSPARITVNFRRFDFDLDPSSLELWIDGVEYTRALRFWSDVAWLDFPVGSGLQGGGHELMARISDHSGAYWAATASISVLFPLCPGGCPWPFAPTDQPSPVSNLMEDWQDFHSTPYFHSGLDIRADAGTDVHSCTSGTVVNVDNYAPGGALKWEVAVQDPLGYVWQYHHLDHNTITVSKGDPVALGQVLGKVVAWTVDVNGYQYDHLHLNIARWFGVGPIGDPYIDGWVYYNPLLYLVHGSYVDSEFPHEFDIYYADNESNTPFSADNDAGTPSLAGNIDVIAHLRDRRTTMAPADGQPYELSPYELAYSIVPINTPCGMGFLPRTRLVRFDVVPGGKLVSKQLQVLETIYKQTVNYSGVTGTHYTYDDVPQFFYAMTNVHNGYPDGPGGSWNTAQLGGLGPLYPDGVYQVKVYAKDIDGNETVTPATVQVSNGQTYTGICPPFIINWGWIQGLKLQSGSGAEYPVQQPAAPIEFGSIVDGSAHASLGSSTWPPWIVDLPDRGLRIGIGLLSGHTAQIEYVPLLGDVIVDADAEMQILPPGGVFDASAASSHPVPLHLTTRLVRDATSGAALIGRPAAYGSPSFRLVTSTPLTVGTETMTLRAGSGAGDNALWGVTPAAVGPSPRASDAGRIRLSAAPNPFAAAGRLQVSLEHAGDVTAEILDMAGRRVRQLYSGRLGEGTSTLQWDGRDALGNRVPAGLYLARVRAGMHEARTKLVLVN